MARHDQKKVKQGTAKRRLQLPDTPLSGRKSRREGSSTQDVSSRESEDVESSASRSSWKERLAGRKKVKWPAHSRERRSLELPDLEPVASKPAVEKKNNVQPETVQIAEPARVSEESHAETGVQRDEIPAKAESEEKSTPLEPQEKQEPQKAQDKQETPKAQDKPEPAGKPVVRRRRKEKKATSAPKVAEKDLRAVSKEPAVPEKKDPLWLRTLRIFLGIGICALAAGAFFLWQRHSKDVAMPPMVTPQPYFYEEEQPVQAILLWHEKVLYSGTSGTVQLTFGSKSAVVATNDVVATVLSRGRTTSVRSPSRGYFIPALDGAEGKWNYSSLWIGEGVLPAAPENHWIKDLSPLGKDRAVGKLIYLPQNPRAIFYLNLTDRLTEGLARGSISIRRVSRGPKWTAKVRVYKKFGEERAKVALDMPGFPMDMISSRSTQFLVCSDEDSGLVVPESAVVIRQGAYGVFELVGDQIIFRKVTGKPVKDGMFFVSSGLSPGNPVILDAANAEEKRVRLW